MILSRNESLKTEPCMTYVKATRSTLNQCQYFVNNVQHFITQE